MSVVKTITKAILLFAVANTFCLCTFVGLLPRIIMIIAAVAVFIVINVKPTRQKLATARLRLVYGGTKLLKIFLISSTLSLALLVFLIIRDETTKYIVINSVICVIVEGFVFWNGILRLYATSVQMGIKWRVIGAVCGWIPIVNIAVLIKLIAIANEEVAFENEKIVLDNVRAENKICKTKYPILLVHGVFFRDISLLNYWGRIPGELKRNGATVYYGEQESAATVEFCAKQIAQRIEKIVTETGCEKLNVIAHSKGGLDTRYAISHFGADKYVASLTTINTPHTGCEFAQYLFYKMPEKARQFLAKRYNDALSYMGDENPDFLGAVKDLTADNCRKINEITPDSADVYYQSFGSKMPKASGGKFPLNFSYHLVKHFDGENDGLVSTDAMKWGSSFKIIVPQGNRGISHGDVIDLNRENIKGFDVREHYVELVKSLKEKGY